MKELSAAVPAPVDIEELVKIGRHAEVGDPGCCALLINWDQAVLLCDLFLMLPGHVQLLLVQLLLATLQLDGRLLSCLHLAVTVSAVLALCCPPASYLPMYHPRFCRARCAPTSCLVTWRALLR
jgi:hypothetical protein